MIILEVIILLNIIDVIKKENIGKFYKDNDGEIWEVEEYCDFGNPILVNKHRISLEDRYGLYYITTMIFEEIKK